MFYEWCDVDSFVQFFDHMLAQEDGRSYTASQQVSGSLMEESTR